MDWQNVTSLPDIGPVPMQQHPAYGRSCAALGTRVETFAAGSRATAQVLIRRWPLFGDFALLARGPSFAADVGLAEARAGTEDLVRVLRGSCRGAMVTSEPLGGPDPMAGSGALQMVTAGSQARLPLGKPDKMLARQHGKWRNRLRRAQDERWLRVEHAPLPAEADHWLILREAAQAKQRNYRRLPPRFTAAWRAENGAKSTRLFVAHYRKVEVAAMLFLLHGKGASYHIGWSDPLGRQCHAHNLLLWEASKWLASRGYAWVDLGTLDTETTPGLARFKLGAGAQPLTLGTTYLDAPGARTVARLFGAGRRGNPDQMTDPTAGQIPAE